jgi:hypothetical protein
LPAVLSETLSSASMGPFDWIGNPNVPPFGLPVIEPNESRPLSLFYDHPPNGAHVGDNRGRGASLLCLLFFTSGSGTDQNPDKVTSIEWKAVRCWAG